MHIMRFAYFAIVTQMNSSSVPSSVKICLRQLSISSSAGNANFHCMTFKLFPAAEDMYLLFSSKLLFLKNSSGQSRVQNCLPHGHPLGSFKLGPQTVSRLFLPFVSTLLIGKPKQYSTESSLPAYRRDPSYLDIAQNISEVQLGSIGYQSITPRDEMHLYASRRGQR
jgi:hypothetical protein